MKNKILLLCVAIVIGTSLIITGCAKPAPAPTPAEPIKLSFASISVETHAVMKDSLTPWAKELEEASGGRLSITIYYARTLIGARETYDAAVTGTADIAYALPIFTPGRFPLISVLDLPFVFSDAKTGSRLAWHLYEKLPEVRDEWKDTKMLALWTIPTGKIHTKNPVKTVEDLKGVKLATTGKVAARVASLLGAAPTDIPGPEQYTSLEQGVVDGCILPFESFEVNKYYEVVKNSLLDGLYGNTMFCVINNNTWASLPADIQKIIEDSTGAKLSNRCGGALYAYEIEAMEKVKSHGGEHYKLPPAELEKVRARVKPVWDEWIAEMEAKGLPGKAVLDEAVRFVAQQK